VNTETHWRESGSSPPLDDVARTLPLAELPEFIGTLAKASALALARLTTPTATASTVELDTLLTPEQTAARLGLTVEQLARKRHLPFRKTIGRRTVRYSSRGIERWLRRAAA